MADKAMNSEQVIKESSLKLKESSKRHNEFIQDSQRRIKEANEVQTQRDLANRTDQQSALDSISMKNPNKVNFNFNAGASGKHLPSTSPRTPVRILNQQI